MTNAQQYIARLTDKLSITETAAEVPVPLYCQHSNHCTIHEMHRTDCHLCRAADVRYVTQHEHGAWIILDSVGLRSDSHGYSDLNDALNHVVYGSGYKAVTGREPSSVHPHSSLWT